MYRIVLVGIAGLAGTLARYWLSGWADERWGMTFPVGTMIVNLLGCLAMGFLFQATAEKFLVDPIVRTAGAVVPIDARPPAPPRSFPTKLHR